MYSNIGFDMFTPNAYIATNNQSDQR